MPQITGAAGETTVPAIAGANAPELQLQSLQQRRELLSGQYETALSERGRVGQERLNAEARGDASLVREYEGVMARTGARMRDLERSIQTIDAQIDALMQSPVSLGPLAVPEPPTPPVPGAPGDITVMPSIPFDFGDRFMHLEYQRMMIGEGVVLLLLGAVLWRLGVARGRKQAARAETPRDDARLQQAVDAIAIEVERLSEGQRFINNIMAGRRPGLESLPVQPLPIPEPRESGWTTPH